MLILQQKKTSSGIIRRFFIKKGKKYEENAIFCFNIVF